MPDAAELEHNAEYENCEGHYESFAAQDFKVRADRQEARERLTQAARHYDRAARYFVEAAAQHLGGSQSGARGSAPFDGATHDRERAGSAYGRAASDYWYAGRAYADAYEFELAAEEMEAAAAAYVAEARLREEDVKDEAAATLRVEASFRYWDAQRYFMQAAEFQRSLAVSFAAVGESQAATVARRHAAELDVRVEEAAGHAGAERPKYHASYESGYR